MKKEKLTKLLKKELGYWFEVETCDDTQYDGFLYLKCQLNNNTLLEIIVHEDWDIPYWFEFFIWREYPLEELKLNDSYSAETPAKLIKSIKEQYSRLKREFKYFEIKESR